MTRTLKIGLKTLALLTLMMLGVAGGASAQAIFTDTFQGTSGTALSAHTADSSNGTGASWAYTNTSYFLSGTSSLYTNNGASDYPVANAAPASASYSVQADFVFKTTPNGYAGISLHSTSTIPGYALLYNGGNFIIYRGPGTPGGFASLVSVAYPVTAPQTLSKVTLVCAVSGSTATLTGYVNGSAVSGLTATDTTATATTIGSAGLWFSEAATPTTLIHLANFAVGTNLVSASAPAALAAATPALSAVTSSTATLTTAAPTGGTSPYTGQWYRNLLSGFSPAVGNAVSGATGLTLSDTGLSAGTPYYYIYKATDSANNTVSSSQVAAVTLPGVVPIGFAGTSITAGYQTTGTFDTPDQCCLALSSLLGDASGVTYHAVNAGVSGSTSSNWVPTDTATETTSGNLATNNYGRSLTAFAAAGVGVVHVEDMGVNDSKTGAQVTVAQHAANMSAIVAGYLSKGYLVALDYPSYVVPGSYNNWDASSVALLQSYEAVDNALAAPGKVFVGKQAYTVIANNPASLADGVHPSNTGGPLLGKTWARPVAAALTYVAAPTLYTGGGQIKRGR